MSYGFVLIQKWGEYYGKFNELNKENLFKENIFQEGKRTDDLKH